MPATRKSFDLFQWLFGAGEERLGQFAEQLLSSPRLMASLAVALQQAAEAKGRVDRNMQMILGAFNLPSKSDLTRLQSKVDAIQGSLVNLSMKIDRLLAEQDGVAKPAPRRAARRPRPEKPPLPSND